MKTTWLLVSAVTALAFGSISAANAEVVAAGSNYTFDFTGTCSDCTGYGTATLQVQDYVLGAPLTDGNLVNFTYNSDLTSLTVNPVADSVFFSDTLSGAITSARGPYNISVSQFFFGVLPIDNFTSSTDGTWSVTNLVPDDVGTNGIWNQAVSAVPEPSTWLLMIAGIGGIGLMQRRSKRATLRTSEPLPA